MPNHHFKLFRLTFQHPQHAASLLRTAMPPALAAAIDWSSLQLCDGSFVHPHFRHRHADLLYEARLHGKPVLLHLLCEHKSSPERFTALQLLGYAVAVLEKWRLEHPGRRFLPPIAPVVVHHGRRRWRVPRRLRALIDLNDLPKPVRVELVRLQPDLGYVLDDFAAVTERGLSARQSTAAAQLTAMFLQFVPGRSDEDVLAAMARWRDMMQLVWSAPSGQAIVIGLLSYLQFVSQVPIDRLREVAARIHEDAETMFVSTATKMRREALAEGKAEGKAELLLRQLTRRFSRVPPEIAARLQAATAAELDLWADRILFAATLDEVFAAQ